MKKQLLLYCCFIALISLTSCADKYERSINKHFNKFILIDDLKDYEIAKIERAYVTEANIKHKQVEEKINSIENSDRWNPIPSFPNKYKPIAIVRFDKSSYPLKMIKIEGKELALRMSSDDVRFTDEFSSAIYQGYRDWYVVTEMIPLSEKETNYRKNKIEIYNNQQKEIRNSLDAKIYALKEELKNVKAIKNSNVVEIFSTVYVAGVTKTGKDEILYDVSQNIEGEIISVN